MTKVIKAVFDGEVLRPKEPLELLPNTEVEVTIATPEPAISEPCSFIETALSLKVKGPPNWSELVEDELEDRRHK